MSDEHNRTMVVFSNRVRFLRRGRLPSRLRLRSRSRDHERDDDDAPSTAVAAPATAVAASSREAIARDLAVLRGRIKLRSRLEREHHERAAMAMRAQRQNLEQDDIEKGSLGLAKPTLSEVLNEPSPSPAVVEHTAEHQLQTCATRLRQFSLEQGNACPVIQSKAFKQRGPIPPASCDLTKFGCELITSISSVELLFFRYQQTRGGRGRKLSFNLVKQPQMENGYSAWHGTSITQLGSILREGLKPGPAIPTGIYTFRDELKDKSEGYCCAVQCVPGIFAKVALHVLAKGLWTDHPPKVMRHDQWHSTKAVVIGIEAEIFHADALSNEEKVLEWERMPLQPETTQVAVKQK